MAKVYEMQRPGYDAVARTLHWLTVLLVAMQFFDRLDNAGRPQRHAAG